MARFGQGFINALTQPAYMEGLFEAGKLMGSAPRRAKEREIQLQRAQAEAQVTQQGAAAAQQGDVAALSNRIGQLTELIKTSNDPKEIARLNGLVLKMQGLQESTRNQATANTAKSILETERTLSKGVLDPKTSAYLKSQGYSDQEIAGLQTKTREALQQQLATMKEDGAAVALYNKQVYEIKKQSLAQHTQDLEMERVKNEQIAQQIIPIMKARNLTSVPNSIEMPDGSKLPIDDKARRFIQTRYVEMQNEEEAFRSMMDGNELEPEYQSYITRNAELIKDNPALTKAIRTINETNGQGPSGRRANALKTLRTLVDADSAEQRKNSTSKEALDGQVAFIRNQIIQDEDRTWFGDTLYDLYKDDSEEAKAAIKLFESQVRNYLRNTPTDSPSFNYQEMIESSIAGIERLVEDERLNQGRQARAKTKVAQRESAIQQIMSRDPKNPLSRLEAEDELDRQIEAERMRRNKGQVISDQMANVL